MSSWQIFFIKREPMLPARNEGGKCGVEGLCESLETAEGALQWPRPEDWSSGEAMDREFGLVFIHEGIPTCPPSL